MPNPLQNQSDDDAKIWRPSIRLHTSHHLKKVCNSIWMIDRLAKPLLWTLARQEAAVQVSVENRSLFFQIKRKVTIDMIYLYRCMKIKLLKIEVINVETKDTNVGIKDKKEDAMKMAKLSNPDVKGL